MGHGIQYCTSCQTQLRDPDFEKGAAYRLENQSYCEQCARTLIATLPEDRVNDILHAFESTHDDPPERRPTERRGNRTTRIMKALAATPGVRLTSTSRRMATVPPEEANSLPMLAGIGAAVAIVVVIALIAMSSGDSPAPKPAAARSSSPTPVVAPEAAPAPEDRPARMLAEAREYARRNPDDLQKQIALFEAVGIEPGASRYAEDLTAVLRELRRKVDERRATALAPVERQIRTALSLQDFKAASASIAEARARRGDADWDRALDRLAGDLDRELARAFEPLRNQAVEAVRRGTPDQARRIQDRVAGWGRPELSRDLDAALAAAAPTPTPPPPPPPPPTLPPADLEKARREAAANELFESAESLHRSPVTRSEALAMYSRLLSEHGATQLVASKRTLVAERLEAAKDQLFIAADLRPTGAWRLAGWKKAGSAWTADADVAAAARPQNFVEISFPALPGIDYAAWVYAGACCAEGLVLHLQGSELPFVDPKTRERSIAEIGSGLYFTLKPAMSLLKGHASHGPRRDPVQWQWVAIPLPRFATAGEKRLRVSGEIQGFSVAWAAVSATRKAPPTDAEMRDVEKQRPAAPPDSPDARLRQGLVAHWRMDDGSGSTVADVSGHGHHGTLRHGGSWSPGVIGKALKLDGDDDQVDCGTNEALNVRKAITLSAWVKCAVEPVQFDGIAMKSNEHWTTGYGFWFENKSQLRFFVGSYGSDFAMSDISPLQWNHVAGTYDGKRVRIYVNGKEGAGKDRVGEIPPCPEKLVIGRGWQVNLTEHTLNGEIDDVRLYDRALDEAEIRALSAVRR